ncbi:MAG TPA: PAS domain-containing sensor histidine kinase [Anaerolineales bacterium]|nr:PAS domain-containing sensor histidine kinase [Anaerolineales bacterium]
MSDDLPSLAESLPTDSSLIIGSANRAELFPILLESAPDAILVVDADARIILANSQAEKMFGYSRQELLGQTIELLVPERFRSLHQSHRQRFFQHPHLRPMGSGLELVARCNDGVELTVEISLSPLETSQGMLVTSVIRDVSARKQAEKALQAAYGQLETRVQERTAELQSAYRELQLRSEELDAFSHTVAHDLKNQIALITGYAEVLRENFQSLSAQNVSHYLDPIARNGYKMGRLVEALLLLATVRKSPMERSALDMRAIVTDAHQRLAYEILQSKAEISLPEKWPVALGYAPWVEEIWVNYLGNALRYGSQPLRIEIGATPQPDGMIRFWVQDFGPGIAPEDQELLFQPFARVASTRSKGHGLGLSIVRRIVERLGGHVSVESQVGLGSCFSFTLVAVDSA